jgi:molecular chaperone GrpE
VSEELRPEQQEPVVRDKRRIDPQTGEVREPAAGAVDATAPAPAEADQAPAGEPASDAQVLLEMQLAERTADLQRLSAEYANYRRRVDRDREVVRETALATVLTGFLPVLDDIDRAAAHGELVGGFKAVADSLTAAVEKLGLVRFGEVGEPFDPTVHEALLHELSAEVTQPTAVQILQPGFRIGERIVRPARVAVAEPDPGA